MVVSFGKKISDQTSDTAINYNDVLPMAKKNTDNSYSAYKVTQQTLTALRLVTKTANYILTFNDDMVLGDATAGAMTLTLPTANGIPGVQKTLKKIDVSSNHITVACNGSETIDGVATKTLSSQWDKITVVSDGTNWQLK